MLAPQVSPPIRGALGPFPRRLATGGGHRSFTQARAGAVVGLRKYRLLWGSDRIRQFSHLRKHALGIFHSTVVAVTAQHAALAWQLRHRQPNILIARQLKGRGLSAETRTLQCLCYRLDRYLKL